MCQGAMPGTGQEHGGEDRALFSEILYSSEGEIKETGSIKSVCLSPPLSHCGKPQIFNHFAQGLFKL